MPPIANAQNAPREPIEGNREAQQIAFPNSLPRGDPSFKRGDPILSVPLVWEFGAIGNTMRVTRYGARKNGVPAKAEIFGARFTIVALDGATRTTTINWPRDADPALAMAVSDGLQVTVRFY